MARYTFVGIIAGILLGSFALATAVEPQYQDYQPTRHRQEYFEIAFDKSHLYVTVFDRGEALTVSALRKNIRHEETAVVVGGSLRFKPDGLEVNGVKYPYREITDSRLSEENKKIRILFYTRHDASQRTRKLKRGNRLSFADNIIVDEDEFVRGVVFSVTGDIEIYGEVNKDVISLFGDVYVAPGAVARGDVATITGRLEVAKDASLYGELYSLKERKAKRRRRFRSERKSLSFGVEVKYNRVDGFTPYGEASFEDSDSLLPSFRARGGYAFASDRWRYEFGLEQTLWRDRPLVIGGSFYRRLASEDDWLLDDNENIVFVALVTEDFKDYYEAEGGRFYLTFKPFSDLTLNTQYRLESTSWREAHPRLWSLFGGDKLFRDNFSSVPLPYRQKGIAELDSTEIAYLSARLEYDTHDRHNPFEKSAWRLSGELERSHPDLNSDFDYTRYTLTLRRYQRVHRDAMLLLRIKYGGSDGYLPMYKKFYLGGLGTLRGYKHKEYMGNTFFMANAEYRIDFPRSNLAASLFWDGGAVSDCSSFEKDDEFKHSLGVGVFLGEDTRINFSKRLDRSFDDSPKIYARFEHRW